MTQKQDNTDHARAGITIGVIVLIVGLAVGLGPIRNGLGGFNKPGDEGVAAANGADAAMAPASDAASATPASTASAAMPAPVLSVSAALAASGQLPAQGASAANASGSVPAAPASEAAAVQQHEQHANGASIVTEPGVVRFYFSVGRADLPADAQMALADIVRGVAAGKRAIVSGYCDASGDAQANAALAKQRAQAVQGVLESLGIGDDKIELRKPQVIVGSGSNAQARRVEVTLE